MQISISAPRTVNDAQILLETINFIPVSADNLHACRTLFAGAEEGEHMGLFGDFGICILGEFTVLFVDSDVEDEEVLFRHADGEIVEML